MYTCIDPALLALLALPPSAVRPSLCAVCRSVPCHSNCRRNNITKSQNGDTIREGLSHPMMPMAELLELRWAFSDFIASLAFYTTPFVL